tara:strand:+ start:3444 stop:4115 length:672 start_codon:yes stop_codon:yes gene_type:complete
MKRKDYNGMMLDSGLNGDVYRINRSQIEKISPDDKMNDSIEIYFLKKLQGMYGIPKYYHNNKYQKKTFHGKHGDGIYNNDTNKLVKQGPASGIVIEYCGEMTLDNYNKLTSNQLQKVMFNVCYIMYILYIEQKILHGDLHRKNIVLKRVNPYSKTYYIENTKFKVSNQLYKVTVIDFDSCTSANTSNQMNDFNYLCTFFENKFKPTNDYVACINLNFESFKTS